MSWNPNQGQDPNPNAQNPYGGYNQPPNNPQGQPGYQYNAYGQPGGQYQQSSSGTAATASPLGPSSIGMDPKIAAGLGYLVGIIGLIFFFIEKQNRFVKFHSLQAIFLHFGFAIVYVILIIPYIIIVAAVAASSSSGTAGGIITLFSCLFGLVGIAWFIGWLIAMIQAFTGKYFKLPLIGAWADNIVRKNTALV